MEYTYIVKFLLLISFGLLMGFLSSMPIGAVQVDVAKKAINGHLLPAVMVAVGSATSDLIYGILTLFGLGEFLFDREFQIGVYILGIVVLSFLLYRSAREHKYGLLQEGRGLVYKKRISFLTGFTIAITNPGMIIWWIVGFKLFIDMNLFVEITPLIKGVFIISGCCGLVGYLVFIASLLNKMQQTVSDRFLHRINIFLMILLSLLITYFMVKVISIIFNYHIGLPV